MTACGSQVCRCWKWMSWADYACMSRCPPTERLAAVKLYCISLMTWRQLSSSSFSAGHVIVTAVVQCWVVLSLFAQSSRTSTLHTRSWRNFRRLSQLKVQSMHQRHCPITSTWTRWHLAWVAAVCRWHSRLATSVRHECSMISSRQCALSWYV